jgi:hypothetical protein
MAQQRVLWEVPQYAGQPEVLGVWSGAKPCKGHQMQRPDGGPKTSNANRKGRNGRGIARSKSCVVDSQRGSVVALVIL